MRSPLTAARNDAHQKVPAAEAFSFLKESKGNLTWTIRDLSKTLNITTPEAKKVVLVLELQGYVKRHGSDWMTTLAGEGVSGAKAMRFTREAVEKALDELRNRIRESNGDTRLPFRVTEAVAFGDFLSGQPRVQSADVGIRLARKSDADQDVPARERAAQQAFLRQLRGRSAMLHFLPHEPWMNNRSHRKLL
jgi:hypothetical protein